MRFLTSRGRGRRWSCSSDEEKRRQHGPSSSLRAEAIPKPPLAASLARPDLASPSPPPLSPLRSTPACSPHSTRPLRALSGARSPPRRLSRVSPPPPPSLSSSHQASQPADRIDSPDRPNLLTYLQTAASRPRSSQRPPSPPASQATTTSTRRRASRPRSPRQRRSQRTRSRRTTGRSRSRSALSSSLPPPLAASPRLGFRLRVGARPWPSCGGR